MTDLPIKFLEKMKLLLDSEYDDFMSSYDAPRVYGLRINPLKLSVSAWREISPMKDRVRPIPWTKDGLYYTEEDRPGRHPHYNAGLYYIQEPSAMLPVELLDVQPGNRVLDLCAAPGGKSTQIAGKLMGEGVIVSNDNAFERTKALAKNIELAGVRNAVITNEEPAKLAEVFAEWFDRILVDAPCSGEGMFRKDESMAASWEKHSVVKCSIMQKDILAHAAAMLAPGGRLVYSTCTFSPEENESQIAAFLAEHPDFYIEPVHPPGGITQGRPDWIDEETASMLEPDRAESLSGTVRLWPHLLEGEGHYAAVLRRRGERTKGASIAVSTAGHPFDEKRANAKRPVKLRGTPAKPQRVNKHVLMEADPKEAWEAFAEKELKVDRSELGEPVAFGSIVYLQPREMPSMNGLKIVRAGWLVGEAKKGRFAPSQALAMGLKREEAIRSLNWMPDAEALNRYLKGETLFIKQEDVALAEGAEPKGYVLVCVDGYPIGWAKYADGMLKNELASGWRRI